MLFFVKITAVNYQDTKNVAVKERDLINGVTGDYVCKRETSLFMKLFPKLVYLKLMENKENRFRAVERDDLEDSTTDCDKIISRLKVELISQ